MDTKILLQKNESKKSVNRNSALNVSLGGKKKLLSSNDSSSVISAYEQYIEERKNCNKIRLTCQVNPICSNILFNSITEIVRDEGSSGVSIVNYGISGHEDIFNGVVYKPKEMSFWSGGTLNYQKIDQNAEGRGSSTSLKDVIGTISSNYTNENAQVNSNYHPTNAIRDMQLSKDDDGIEDETRDKHFVYHCGLDILNNHLIRSKSFKPISTLLNKLGTQDYSAFNTIADMMRDVYGDKVAEKVYYPINVSSIEGGAKIIAKHAYEYDDIYTFEEAVEKTRVEKHNGWFGFKNSSKIKSYDEFNKEKPLNIDRPIMYMNGGDFVDMYPSRDLYSFVPKWNKFQNRIEKNWNYCITYPSSSTTDGFEEIIETNNGVNSLKAIYFDENTTSDNGAKQLVIYSISKHGLNEGDYVNIYKTYIDSDTKKTEMIINEAQVSVVVDDYIFIVFNSNVKISDSWVLINQGDVNNGITVNGVSYEYKGSGYFNEIGKDDGNKYYIINQSDKSYGYVNFDDTAQNISYKKVVGGIECDYYVRIFSKLPNFKYASGSTSEYDLYKSGSTMINEYQKKEYEFENHISSLAFAKNIYSDDIGQVVFTDDIDISNIKDNLGRPLTSLYFTIIKNNKGYKEWYGFGDKNWEPSSILSNAESIEFSHCFGEIKCGLAYSDESSVNNFLNSIKKISLLNFPYGFNCAIINNNREGVGDNELSYEKDVNFYGDLSYYDSFNAIERHIQPILHRVNTAQRESSKSKSNVYFSRFFYDEIKRDDYDGSGEYEIEVKNVGGCNTKKEGYYYLPHYEIPIKSFDKLSTVMPTFLTMRSLVNTLDGTRITCLQNHFLGVGDKTMIYNIEKDEYYHCITTSSDNGKVFVCNMFKDNGKKVEIPNIYSSSKEKSNYRLFKLDNLNIPSYAHIIKDGTCRFIWRNIINNGLNTSDKSIEEYPFTNGAFYVNKRVDLYLRRQDPYGIYGLYSEDDVIGNEMKIENEDNYVKGQEIKC